MKKALITGITGQDGAYLARELLSKGYSVSGIIRTFQEPHLSNLKYLNILDDVELISANLFELPDVFQLLKRIRPDEVYNLAAQSSVGASFERPLETVDFNIRSTHNLLEAIRTIPLKTKFYQASSSEMFGKVTDLPVTEKTVLHPVSPYAISKAASHWLTVNYREAYGLFTCCGILFNHESVLRPQNFVTKKVLSTAVRIHLGSKEKLILGNIDIKRDWGYAPEYVKAMWQMLQQDTPDDYILATNEPRSLKDFIHLTFICLGLNWQDHVVTDQSLYRPSDIECIYGNPDKARRQLNWDYQIPFESLVNKLVAEELAFQESIFNFDVQT